MACSWDTGPALVSAAGSYKHVTAQDQLLLRREYSRVRDRDRDRDAAGRAVEEVWLLGSDIAEIFLLCPDTERLSVLAASLTLSAVSEIASGGKREAVAINDTPTNSNETVIFSESFTSDSAATSASQRCASDEREEGFLRSDVSEAQSGMGVLEQQDVRSGCRSSVELSVEGAKKKRRKGKGKGNGKELGSNSHHQLNVSSLRNIASLPSPHVQSSLLCSQLEGLTELSHATAQEEEGEQGSSAVTACDKSSMKLRDTAPASAEVIVTSQNSSSSFSSLPLLLPHTATNIDDDIDAAPMTASFADVFEALLSEKRKDME